MNPALVYMLYALFAVGGLALYLAMPRTDGGMRQAGLLIGLGAVIGLMVMLGSASAAPQVAGVFFYLFAGLAVLAGGAVVTHPRPVYSAVYFALVVLCVAVLAVMQRAEFLAAALVIVYAGAILVTYVFVIMLAQQSGASVFDLKAREPLLSIVVAFVAMGLVAGRLASLPPPTPGDQTVSAVADPIAGVPPATPAPSNTLVMGRQLFGPLVIAVQVAGLLLLVAMVGAIAMARKRVPVEESGPPPPALGEIGRQVPPF